MIISLFDPASSQNDHKFSDDFHQSVFTVRLANPLVGETTTIRRANRHSRKPVLDLKFSEPLYAFLRAFLGFYRAKSYGKRASRHLYRYDRSYGGIFKNQARCQTSGNAGEARSAIAEGASCWGGGGGGGGGLRACPQKIVKSRSSGTLFSAFFIMYFFRKINLVQLGIIFST